MTALASRAGYHNHCHSPHVSFENSRWFTRRSLNFSPILFGMCLAKRKLSIQITLFSPEGDTDIHLTSVSPPIISVG